MIQVELRGLEPRNTLCLAASSVRCLRAMIACVLAGLGLGFGLGEQLKTPSRMPGEGVFVLSGG